MPLPGSSLRRGTLQNSRLVPMVWRIELCQSRPVLRPFWLNHGYVFCSHSYTSCSVSLWPFFAQDSDDSALVMSCTFDRSGFWKGSGVSGASSLMRFDTSSSSASCGRLGSWARGLSTNLGGLAGGLASERSDESGAPSSSTPSSSSSSSSSIEEGGGGSTK